MEMPESWKRLREEGLAEGMVVQDPEALERARLEQDKSLFRVFAENPGKTAEGFKRLLKGAGAMFAPGMSQYVAGKEALGGENVTEQLMGEEPRDLAGWERLVSGVAAMPVMGMLKGIGAPVLREMMRAEIAARGARPTAEGLPRLMHDVVSGSWWHGRRTFPKQGESFGGSMAKVGNLGEPTGISLSKEPGKAAGFGGKIARKDEKLDDAWEVLHQRVMSKIGYDPMGDFYSPSIVKAFPEVKEDIEQMLRIDRIKDTRKIARVFPLVGGPPGEKILPGWVGPGTEDAQQLLKDVYSRAVMKSPAQYYGIAEAPLGKEVQTYAQEGGRERINKLITGELQDRGFEGILYSPRRYNEYELKMFDPDKVVNLGKKFSGLNIGLAEMQRVPGRRMVLDEWRHAIANEASGSLRDIYQNVTFKDLARAGDEVIRKPPTDVEVEQLMNWIKRISMEGRGKSYWSKESEGDLISKILGGKEPPPWLDEEELEAAMKGKLK